MRTFHLLILAAVASCGADSSPLERGADAGEVDAGPPAQDAGPVAADAGDGSAALGRECDPRAPGCATGEKCVATRWALEEPWPAPRCVPDLGSAGRQAGEVCFAASGLADGCGSGLACTNFGSGEGFCRRTCARGEACDEGEVCAPVDPQAGFALCLDACSDDTSCGAAGWLKCTERDGLRYCESTRAE
jgi:hypothetical protein